jgi:hypothetical protein
MEILIRAKVKKRDFWHFVDPSLATLCPFLFFAAIFLISRFLAGAKNLRFSCAITTPLAAQVGKGGCGDDSIVHLLERNDKEEHYSDTLHFSGQAPKNHFVLHFVHPSRLVRNDQLAAGGPNQAR